MSERDVKVEEEHKDVQDDGGDDEVRDGPFYALRLCQGKAFTFGIEPGSIAESSMKK